MSTFDRLCEVFDKSEELSFDNSSKIVLISDCHRGDGTWSDDFSRNTNIFYSALKYYYDANFTYIDLGDSDELWKYKSYTKICNTYPDTMAMTHAFYDAGRYYLIAGNHDMIKENHAFIQKQFKCYYNVRTDKCEPLFENIRVHEGLILRHQETNSRILLVHGHQGDWIADIFWRLGRFLTRHIWKRIESLGLKDPTSAAINFALKKKVEKKIIEWVKLNNRPVICGHTHRPACPSKNAPPYFNTGCCIYPDCITCLEIVNSEISLVKWDIKTNEDRLFYVDREVIAAPWKIEAERDY